MRTALSLWFVPTDAAPPSSSYCWPNPIATNTKRFSGGVRFGVSYYYCPAGLSSEQGRQHLLSRSTNGRRLRRGVVLLALVLVQNGTDPSFDRANRQRQVSRSGFVVVDSFLHSLVPTNKYCSPGEFSRNRIETKRNETKRTKIK